MNQPLVSIIVPTKNNHDTLDACLESIKTQSYPNIELIVVDNNSIDDTKPIASKYTKHVHNLGPERSAQRNFGASEAKGKYLLFIDSDMELTRDVVEACISMNSKAVIIPEESFGVGFWAKCKQLERSYYIGNDAIEAARFFDRELFLKVGGYDIHLVAGEDWELSSKIRKHTTISRIEAFIRHNEGQLKLTRSVRKKYYYAQSIPKYLNSLKNKSVATDPSGPLFRYKLFLSRPKNLIRNPVVSLGMLCMKTAEYGAGALGYMKGRIDFENRD